VARDFERSGQGSRLTRPKGGTGRCRKAKRFVEEFFASAKEILITTTKPDKWDRYLTDTWVGKVNLNQLLLDKGLARLKTTVSPDDWGEPR
jgi:endonuclease YncB( thermonuclease family)